MEEAPLMTIKADPLVPTEAVDQLTEMVMEEIGKRRDEERAKTVELLPKGYDKDPRHKFVRGKEHGGNCVLCDVKWSEHFHTLRDVELAFARQEGKEWKRLTFYQRQRYHKMAADWVAGRITQ